MLRILWKYFKTLIWSIANEVYALVDATDCYLNKLSLSVDSFVSSSYFLGRALLIMQIRTIQAYVCPARHESL